MIADQDILDAIDAQAPALKIPEASKLDRRALLAAITWPETSFCRRRYASKDEKAYKPGGLYFKAMMPSLWEKYGVAAASSWGAWQEMYVAAVETGFIGHPWDLTDSVKSCKAAIALLNARCFRFWPESPKVELRMPATTLAHALDFWNSGSFRDDRPPIAGYLQKGKSGYIEACEIYDVAVEAEVLEGIA
jgi:hypothetical protein